MPAIHRSPRTRAARVATVSAGTLLLSLTAAAPAFADIGPLPAPTPPPPVGDLVGTVSDLTGLPNPLDATSPTADTSTTTQQPRHHRHHRTADALLTRNAGTPAPAPTAASDHRVRAADRPTATLPTAVTIPVALDRPVTGLAVMAAKAPLTAPAPATSTVRLATATTPRVDPAGLPGSGDGQPLRLLLIAVAASVLATVASVHARLVRALVQG